MSDIPDLSGLKKLLESTTISSFITDRTTFYLEPTATVSDAVKLLTEKQILSAPVCLRKDATTLDCLGFVDVLDCCAHVLENVDKYLRTENVNWSAFQTSILYSDVSSILNQSDKNPFLPYTSQSTLLEPLKQMSTGVHRVPVFNDQGTLYGLLTQSDYVSFLYTKKDLADLSFVMKSTISELGYKVEILTTGVNEYVFDVLSMMKRSGLSAIPLVNEMDQICGCFSASDLRNFPLEDWRNLFLGVGKFLEIRHPNSLQPVTVNENSTFSDVLESMFTHKVHRVFVIDDQKKPVGAVSMTDIARWLNLLLN